MTKETLENKTECEFDKKDGCHAMVCYRKQMCNSRDENRNPIYVSLEIIKKEKGYIKWQQKNLKRKQS